MDVPLTGAANSPVLNQESSRKHQKPPLKSELRAYLIPFLLSLPGFGVSKYWQLRNALQSINELLNWPLEHSCQVLPLSAREIFTDFYQQRQQSIHWRKIEKSCRAVEEQGVRLIDHEMNEYPSLLRKIDNPPPVLFVKGSVEALSFPQLAFVGSRNASVSGLETAFSFAHYLASAGITVTSGFALGIDGRAHLGALSAGGVTIAVLGSGIDRIYPASHVSMVEKIIAQGGAVISEFLPGTKPHPGNFPRRNRIISGLSLGVLVVEAALKSGSLITARYAIEQNRDVFAIPGSIHNPLSRGCHALIRDGAVLVETAEDIACELSHWLTAQPNCKADDEQKHSFSELQSDAERQLWRSLDFNPVDVDHLAVRSGLSAHELLPILMAWVLEGRIRQDGNDFRRL